MAQTNVNIRMDAELKRQFEEFCADVGMSMTTAFTVFAKKTVRENRIPFSVDREIPNEETREAIEETQRMMADPSYGRSYTDVDEMMRELLG
ncbi:type II toxin-antitoxin system RelB/DinJ family antitoxin [Colidextribacter sp. OB.20]|uniref:type II toxin-antitoxin system RelB/DinJ family antitoxin n=1 Tax=Colidextribacter sp. OB.20 TaxID=2304568 RepID=UPI00136B5642|nr:type II toxin-antitoxin system RelB/DinJ family antitoxin [Colidextribacter sp. OB.20]NBI08735.1 type II toxin-antitoxin system RelB/DinJ family antitoxin [Colidextribacter sp. OB.20]